VPCVSLRERQPDEPCLPALCLALRSCLPPVLCPLGYRPVTLLSLSALCACASCVQRSPCVFAFCPLLLAPCSPCRSRCRLGVTLSACPRARCSCAPLPLQSCGSPGESSGVVVSPRDSRGTLRARGENRPLLLEGVPGGSENGWLEVATFWPSPFSRCWPGARTACCYPPPPHVDVALSARSFPSRLLLRARLHSQLPSCLKQYSVASVSCLCFSL
jgi:hypothetical protein